MTQLDYSKFKTEINLTQYAAHLGYEIDRKKSTRSSIAMRKDSDKVIISKRGNLWVYFSVTDDNDNGTIIDFAEKRTHKSIGEIGRELQNWIGGGVSLPDAISYVREVAPQEYDPARIAGIFKSLKPVYKHRYLASRGLTDALLTDKRFVGRVFTDRYQNAAFPHFKDGQVCGLELKNHDKAIRVLSPLKTLWRSYVFKGDNTLILAEAVIDALSYHALYNRGNAVYAATGGGLSPEQSQIITAFIRNFANLEHIIIIPDHDQGGDKFEKRIREAVELSGFEGLCETHRPCLEGQDWNDVYKDTLEKTGKIMHI